MKKRLFRLLLFAAILAGSFLQAGELGNAGQQSVKRFKGSNIDAQDYQTYGSPITSYLTRCTDGRLMRVQSASSVDGILVEYYDASYQLLSSQIIPQELSRFGGFYETENDYFLLTGQSNYEESEEKDVYRITKYDKDWKRIASAGLNDCNTAEPFAFGSARMVSNGKYLFIHTCHVMYESSDGLNHQANVIMQLDMESMEITDSLTGISDPSFGYVSHSFNQFIKVEENHVIIADHGDAYPRAAVVLKYPTDASKGTFTVGHESSANDCSAFEMLAFSGGYGVNSTGASLGGFEISDTSYLVAGNSVVQDRNNLNRKTRNIFVAAADKKAEGRIQIAVNVIEKEIIVAIDQPENAVSRKWLTNYSEGTESVSTPHLVKINQNAYLVLWSRAEKVYYTAINGKGEQTGKIYMLNGNLSDCVPIVANGKLVWYTWKDEAVDFYEISLNDLSKSRVVKRSDGDEGSKRDKRPDGKIFSASGASYQVTGSNTADYVKPPKTKTVKIPETVRNGNKTYRVTGIAANAFFNNHKVTQVTIGNRVLTIGKNAFAGCKKLKRLTIGKNVKTIREKAFYGDRKLKSITIKTKKLAKKSVGKKAFQKLHPKAVIKVPAKKRAAYKKMLKASGFSGKCK